MEEPSVLDYLKAKLTPWRGPAPQIPPLEGEAEAFPERDVAPAQPGPEVVVEPSLAPSAQLDAVAHPEPVSSEEAAASDRAITFPWRPMLALLAALLAQGMLGPPDRNARMGVIFYAIAAGLTIWSFWRSEWTISSSADAPQSSEPFTIRRLGLFVGLPLAILSYLTFRGNLVTELNFLVWILTIGYFGWAFWLPNPHGETLLVRLRKLFRRDRWQLTISRQTILVMVGIALVIFFRVYRLGDVPPEMTSDHAEKLLDVADVLRGETHIFFPRNAGREAFQMYLNAGIVRVLGTGLTFLTLKIGTVIPGLLTLPLIYLIGKEIANTSVGLWAAIFAGIAYWPNVISRVGLRFSFYPLFTALTLYFVIKGLRTSNRNHFILAGLALGLSVYGYTADRILPIVVLVAFGLFFLHKRAQGRRKEVILWLTIVVIMALIAFIPLFRYFMEEPEMVAYRSMTRLSGFERPLPGPAWEIFLGNLWDALTMFTNSGGNVFIASNPFYPALGVVTGALAHIGVLLMLLRYVRRRNWLDLFLLVSVPLLMLPSILALAFPIENPNLYRTGGALVPVFLLVGMAVDGLLKGLKSSFGSRWGLSLAWGVGLMLLVWSSVQNYEWVFNDYFRQYQLSAWNTTEIGHVIRAFADSIGEADSAWVVPNPHWVDTRLVGINAGYPDRDYALWPDGLPETLADPRAKLFVVRPVDEPTVELLDQLYPQGSWDRFTSAVNADKDFLTFYVPPEENSR
jgi:hypothetical protein